MEQINLLWVKLGHDLRNRMISSELKAVTQLYILVGYA